MDTFERGSPYERYIGRWSRRVAPAFLSWLGVPAGRRWLDVGCGTGALCAAISDLGAPAAVTGVEPSAGFLEAARVELGGRVTLRQGSATQLPLADRSVDVVVSGLVLNFIEDPRAALLEMSRVAVKGGTIAAYVWDYAGQMELLRVFWDAAIELDPAAAALDEGVRFPQCRPDALERLFSDARLNDVASAPLDQPTPFASFDDYWEPFLGGQGPAPTYVTSLAPPARTRLREHLRARLPVGAFTLTARAWAVRGSVERA